MHSVRIELAKLILVVTRITYQATGDAGWALIRNYSSEARFLIDPSPKKSSCVCSTNLGFSVEKMVLVLVRGTYYVPHTYVCTWYQRALRCQLRGRPFHPCAGRLRFSGEAHPGPATHLRRRDGTVRIFFHCTGERKSRTLSAPRQYVALQVIRTSYHINII